MNELIIITAVWCSSCLTMTDTINKSIAGFTDLNIRKLDYDFDEIEVKKYNVGNILPVLILNDKKGNELGRLVGEQSISEVKSFLNNNWKFL